MQVQEYVEAATLYKFCKTGNLLNLDEINAVLLPLSDHSQEPLQINVLDYILGVTTSTLIQFPSYLSNRPVESKKNIYIKDKVNSLSNRLNF